MHNLGRTSGFADAIRTNIYAGGDNCGRAIVLGAVSGAHFGSGGATGIPKEWVSRVNAIDHIESLLTDLFGT